MRRTKQHDFDAHSALANAIRVRAATIADLTIATALNDGDTLDGVTLADGDLVLVKDQSSAAENGIYVVATVPQRHPDYIDYDPHAGLTVTVEEGTAGGSTTWLCTASRGGTIDSTALTFALKMPAAGAQPLDALLTAIAALLMVADRYIYGTGTDTVALGTITSFARTLLDDTSAGAARTTLGLGGLATLDEVTNSEIDLTSGSIVVRIRQDTTDAPGNNLSAFGGALGAAISWYADSGPAMELARDDSGTIVAWRHGAGGGTLVGSVSVNSISTSYNTSSERILKKNIRDLPSASAVERIQALRMREFEWVVTDQTGRGVVADEAEAVIPESVSLMQSGLRGVDYSKFVPDLVGTVQSLLADNAALTARVAALEALKAERE